MSQASCGSEVESAVCIGGALLASASARRLVHFGPLLGEFSRGYTGLSDFTSVM